MKLSVKLLGIALIVLGPAAGFHGVLLSGPTTIDLLPNAFKLQMYQHVEFWDWFGSLMISFTMGLLGLAFGLYVWNKNIKFLRWPLVIGATLILIPQFILFFSNIGVSLISDNKIGLDFLRPTVLGLFGLFGAVLISSKSKRELG